MPLHSFRRRTAIAATLLSNAAISNHQLQHAVHGVSYPAQKWQLQSWAYFNGSSSIVMPAISELPEREYADFQDVSRELHPEPTH